MKIILWAVGLYILYKLIFDFILPIYTNAKRIRRQFQDVQENMQAQQRAHAEAQQQYHQTQQQQHQNTTGTGRKSGVGEYIDFEEVK